MAVKKSLQEKTNTALTSHAVSVNKYAYSQRKAIIAQLRYILNDVRNELLAGADKVTPRDVQSMTKKAVKLFKEKFGVIRNNIDTDLTEFLATDALGQTELMEKLMAPYNDEYTYKVDSDEQLKKELDMTPVQGLLILDWLDRWESGVSARMRGGILQNSMGNITEDNEVEDAYRGSIVAGVFGVEGEDDVLSMPVFSRAGVDLNAQLLSFTDAATAVVALSLLNNNTGAIKGSQWNSCLCNTTCPSCASLHGLIRYTDGKDETGGATIPLHMNCLCHWSYVYQDANVMNARIARDQQSEINSPTNLPKFTEYYNGLSSTKQKQLFGTKRVELLNSGKITVNKLLDIENGRRVFTLEELRKQGYSV